MRPTNPLRRSVLRICSPARLRTTQVLPDDDGVGSDSPWAARDGFQLGGARSLALPVVIDGESASATVTYGKDGTHVAVDGVAPATRRQSVRGGRGLPMCCATAAKPACA